MPEAKQHHAPAEAHQTAERSPAETCDAPTDDQDGDTVDRLSAAVDDLDEAAGSTGGDDHDVDELITEVDALEDTDAAPPTPPSLSDETRTGDAPDQTAPHAASLPTGEGDVDPQVLEALMDSEYDAAEQVLTTVFETKAELVQKGQSSEVTIRREVTTAAGTGSDATAGVESATDSAADGPPAQSDRKDPADEARDDNEAEAQLPADPEPQPEAEQHDSDDVDEDPAAAPASPSTEADEQPAETADGGTSEPAGAAPPSEPPRVVVVEEDPVDAVEPDAAPAEAANHDEPEAAADPADDPVDVVAPPETEADADEASKPVAERESEAEPETAASLQQAEAVEEDEPSGGKISFIAWLLAQLRRLLDRAAPALTGILRTVNLPLRFVPPKLRPLVDYLALTLIMWVPIVWAIVWLVRQ